MERHVTDPFAQPPQPSDPYQSAQPPYGQPQQPVSPAYPPPHHGPAQPAYGQPAYFPGGQQPPAKSNKGLIIGIVAGVLVLLLVLCGVGVWLFANAADDDPVLPDPKPTRSSSTAAPAPTAQQPGGNNALTARYSSDFAEVCQGGAILNAADYTPGAAKAYVFANSPDRPTRWNTKSVNSTKPYYAKSADYTTVSVVGCLTYVEGSEAQGQKCEIKATDGKKLTVDYLSSRYTLTFHAAKTGEKVADGGTINAPANRCPSFLTYNKETLKSYASPDSGSLDAALDKLLVG